MLRRLNIPVLNLLPDDLQTVARICLELRSIRVLRLSDVFLELPASDLPVSCHPLHEIRLCYPSKVADPANVMGIARFSPISSQGFYREHIFKPGKPWHEILQRVVEIHG